jgi:hypothetical protein
MPRKNNTYPLIEPRRFRAFRYEKRDGKPAQRLSILANPQGRDPLDIQVLHIERVVFDELAAGFYVLAH